MSFNPKGSRVDFNLFGEYNNSSSNGWVILQTEKCDAMEQYKDTDLAIYELLINNYSTSALDTRW